MHDDQGWIDRVIAGDAQAFEPLIRAYQDRLFHAVRNMVGDFQEAEDICQEAFIKAYRNLAQFRQESAFYTWLFRIALNTARSRKRKHHPTVSLIAGSTGMDRELPAPSVPVDAGLMAADRSAHVQAALHDLPTEFREILILREIEDYDYETIASMLEIPIGTVRSRIHRARQALQLRLAAGAASGGTL